MKIVITADGRNLTATTGGQPLTSGSVGIEAAFILSADYDGLAVTAVFSAGETRVDVLLTTPCCIVPWEVLQEPKATLFVGVVGKNGSGEIVIPTVWGRVGMIECGTVADGLDPEDPTPDIAAQILEQARAALEEAEETKEAAAQSAETAGNEADRAEAAREAIEDLGVTAHEDPDGPSVEKTVDPETGAVTLDFGFKPAGVTEVNGQTGAVSLDLDDIPDGAQYVRPTPAQVQQIGTNKDDIADIEDLIPNQATPQNQLADKAFVNSSINSSAAFFRGAFPTRAALFAVAWQTSDPTGANYVSNNDYAYVADDETNNDEAWRYLYVLQPGGTNNGWQPQFRVNESPLTAAQLAALNSGATAEIIASIADKYELPEGGMPAADMSDAVRASLQKADTALQAVPDTYRTAAEQDVIDQAQDERIDSAAQATTSTTLGPAPIATFDASAADMPLKGLTVDIEPVQDLHGYDHPWPGGGGKNLLPYPYLDTTKTVGALTLTDNGDGTVTANGSNTSVAYFNMFRSNQQDALLLKAGTYKIPATGNGNIQFNWYYVGGEVIATGNTERIFTISEDSYVYCFLRYEANINFSNVITKPMLLRSTETDTTFAPYSNICPISGWTGCNILQYPENLLSISDIKTGRITSDGGFNASTTTRCATLIFIPVSENAKYTIATNAGVQCIAVHYYKNDQSWLYRDAITGQVSTFTTPANCAYIRLMFAKDDTNLEISPSDITTAILMRGNTYNITFPASAGAVYGGTLDVVNGKLTVDRVAVGMETLTWTNPGENRYRAAPPNLLIANTRTLEILCTCYKSNIGGGAFEDKTIYNVNDTIYVVDTAFGSLLSPFRESIVGQTVVYPLATPIVYDLSDVPEITTLLGTNNIWADTGNVTVTYGAYLETVKAHAERLGDSILSAIAPLEASYTASRTYAVGSYLFVGTKFYKVTAAIGSGDTINPGTNVTQTTVAAQLMELAGN